ncbi:hypothetical protein Poly30_55120 [Planctomycetes bacterium Poly30]|uniref:Chemotaxis phosphatase CheX-like domain-containing protein n=1 Tax=Saltatorellus ferox TaxID=2528018 RepID=A0A518F0T5_9BACT|nr:hypothetical protein Poly30_55120 [Planctomycetes bacterium Poly30]
MKLAHLAQTTLDDAGRALIPAVPPGAKGEPAQLCRAAVIGFAGSQVRGTLGVATSQAGLDRILARTGPSDDLATCDRTRAEDSLAELSNLLLGAIKRAWVRRGLEFTLATPLVIRGLSIEICGGENNQWFSTESSAGDDRVTSWLDIHYDENLEVPDHDVETDLVAEGETLLF